MSITLIGVICAQVAAALVADVVMVWRHVEPRSILGRAFVYRLAEGSRAAWPAGVFTTRDEHAEQISRLKASTSDEALLQTIDIVATTRDNSWVPAFNRVQHEIVACANCCNRFDKSNFRWAETDRRLNQVAWLALLSFDPVLIRDAILRTGEVLAPFFIMPPFYPDLTWFSWNQLTASWDLTGSSRERFDGPAMVKHFRWHLGTDFSIVINLAIQLRGVMFIAAIGLLAVLLPFARSAIPLCFGLLSAAIAYAAMISLVTVYEPRYGLPVDLLALFAIVVAIVSTYETRWRTSPGEPSDD